MLCFTLFLAALTVVQSSPIINGDSVSSAEDYPFVVRLFITSKDISKGKIVLSQSLCTGVLVTLDFVVTAAHCLDDHVSRPHVVVKAGIVDLVEEISETALMLDYKKHRNYDPSDITSDKPYLKNDIAVIWLNKQFKQSSKIRAASINCVWKDFAGLKGVGVGWGETNVEDNSKTLHKTNLKVLSEEVCEKAAKTPLYKQFCVALLKKRSHPAEGDSGGPLVIQNKVVGICSWMANDGRLKPVYVRIDAYIDWLSKTYEGGPLNTAKKFAGSKIELQMCQQRSRDSSSSSNASSRSGSPNKSLGNVRSSRTRKRKPSSGRMN